MARDVVVAGWAQITQPKHQQDGLLDPLGLMLRASVQAGERARVPLQELDAVLVVRPMSASYADAAGDLARELGATPRTAEVSRIGGNSPQTLVNRAAGMIARGEAGSVLVVGAETYYRRDHAPPDRDTVLFQGVPDEYHADDLIGTTDLEARHGVVAPIHGFPLLETAQWARTGRSIDDHLRDIGRTWAQFSEVAARHPNAWIRRARTVDEFITPCAVNRQIAFPYRKFLNSLVAVDMGAALLLTATAAPRAGERPVYFRGGAYAEDRQRFIVQREDLTTSAPLHAAASRALDRAGLGLDDMQAFDLYSCFPCAISIARNTLGLDTDDPRPLTLTGGLGSFGGPGNNYSLHGIATLAEAIADGSLDRGLVTAFGWFLHKHAAGVYAAEPGGADLGEHDLADADGPLVGDAPLEAVEEARGRGTIETYTVIHERDGAARHGIVYGRIEDGRRFVAHASAEDSEAMVVACHVGDPVDLEHDPRTRLNHATLRQRRPAP